MAAAAETDGCSARRDSISPSSIRKPRSLIWWSSRPRYSTVPSGRYRARSPVRYRRAPGSPEKGSAMNRSAVSSGRLRYPRASPAPPISSSPGTPIGAGTPRRSRMYRLVLPIGRPIVSRWPGSVRWAHVDQIVVSVGPYMFHRSRPRAISSSASAGGSASPPQSARSPGVPFHPESTSIRHVVGVACMAVAPDSRIRAASAAGSAAVAADASTTWAPVISGRYSSSPAMSNERVVTATRRSSAVSPGRCAIVVRKLTTARCGICTPFGCPVEPEV